MLEKSKWIHLRNIWFSLFGESDSPQIGPDGKIAKVLMSIKTFEIPRSAKPVEKTGAPFSDAPFRFSKIMQWLRCKGRKLRDTLR